MKICMWKSTEREHCPTCGKFQTLFSTHLPEEPRSWLPFDPAIVFCPAWSEIPPTSKQACCRTVAERMDCCQPAQRGTDYFTWSRWTCRSSFPLLRTGFENGRWISVTYVPIPQRQWFPFFKLRRNVRSQGKSVGKITTYFLSLNPLDSEAFSQIQKFIPNLPFMTGL